MPEFLSFSLGVQDAILTAAGALQAEGPTLGRPLIDTLKGSAFSNMKELRIGAGGAWRVAFAFDPVARRSCWSLAKRRAQIEPSFAAI